jgi:hypothetical protein
VFTSSDYWLHDQRLQEIREDAARDRLAALASQTRASSARVDTGALTRTLTAALTAIAAMFAKV